MTSETTSREQEALQQAHTILTKYAGQDTRLAAPRRMVAEALGQPSEEVAAPTSRTNYPMVARATEELTELVAEAPALVEPLLTIAEALLQDPYHAGSVQAMGAFKNVAWITVGETQNRAVDGFAKAVLVYITAHDSDSSVQQYEQAVLGARTNSTAQAAFFEPYAECVDLFLSPDRQETAYDRIARGTMTGTPVHLAAIRKLGELRDAAEGARRLRNQNRRPDAVLALLTAG